MRALLGTKVGMSSVFDEQGRMHAVTIVYVEPNKVIAVKTKEKDGYDAIQVGYETIKEKNVNKPKKGQFKKANSDPKRYIKEFRNSTGNNVGDEIKVDIFKKGDYIDVQGITKGHGFTGSIKRHNFAIGPLGHGAGYPHRYVGSISGGRGGSQAQRVFKGTELPGHYGHENVTIQNLLIVDVIPNENLMVIKGAIPGNKKGLVYIRSSKKMSDKNNEIKLFNPQGKKDEPAKEVKAKEEVTSEKIEAATTPNEEAKPVDKPESKSDEGQSEEGGNK